MNNANTFSSGTPADDTVISIPNSFRQLVDVLKYISKKKKKKQQCGHNIPSLISSSLLSNKQQFIDDPSTEATCRLVARCIISNATTASSYYFGCNSSSNNIDISNYYDHYYGKQKYLFLMLCSQNGVNNKTTVEVISLIAEEILLLLSIKEEKQQQSSSLLPDNNAPPSTNLDDLQKDNTLLSLQELVIDFFWNQLRLCNPYVEQKLKEHPILLSPVNFDNNGSRISRDEVIRKGLLMIADLMMTMTQTEGKEEDTALVTAATTNACVSLTPSSVKSKISILMKFLTNILQQQFLFDHHQLQQKKRSDYKKSTDIPEVFIISTNGTAQNNTNDNNICMNTNVFTMCRTIIKILVETHQQSKVKSESEHKSIKKKYEREKQQLKNSNFLPIQIINKICSRFGGYWRYFLLNDDNNTINSSFGSILCAIGRCMFDMPSSTIPLTLFGEIIGESSDYEELFNYNDVAGDTAHLEEDTNDIGTDTTSDGCDAATFVDTTKRRRRRLRIYHATIMIVSLCVKELDRIDQQQGIAQEDSRMTTTVTTTAAALNNLDIFHRLSPLLLLRRIPPSFFCLIRKTTGSCTRRCDNDDSYYHLSFLPKRSSNCFETIVEELLSRLADCLVLRLDNFASYTAEERLLSAEIAGRCLSFTTHDNYLNYKEENKVISSTSNSSQKNIDSFDMAKQTMLSSFSLFHRICYPAFTSTLIALLSKKTKTKNGNENKNYIISLRKSINALYSACHYITFIDNGGSSNNRKGEDNNDDGSSVLATACFSFLVCNISNNNNKNAHEEEALSMLQDNCTKFFAICFGKCFCYRRVHHQKQRLNKKKYPNEVNGTSLTMPIVNDQHLKKNNDNCYSSSNHDDHQQNNGNSITNIIQIKGSHDQQKHWKPNKKEDTNCTLQYASEEIYSTLVNVMQQTSGDHIDQHQQEWVSLIIQKYYHYIFCNNEQISKPNDFVELIHSYISIGDKNNSVDVPTTGRFHLCLWNSLILVSQRCAEDNGQLEYFARNTLPWVTAWGGRAIVSDSNEEGNQHETKDEMHTDSLCMAAALQITFILITRTKSFNILVDSNSSNKDKTSFKKKQNAVKNIHNWALQSIQKSLKNTILRSTALKLLMAVVAVDQMNHCDNTRTDECNGKSFLDTQEINAIFSVLKGIANTDPDPDIQNLVKNILGAII